MNTFDADLVDLTATLEADLAAGRIDFGDMDPEAMAIPGLDALTAADFTTKPDLATTRYRQPPRPKILHPRLIRHDNAKLAASALWPLAPGERVHMLCSGNFIFGDLIEAAAVANDWLIAELWIGTLSLSVGNIESLANLFAGDYLRDLHIQVSDYWYAHNRGHDGLLEYLYQEVDPPPQPDASPDDKRRFQLSVSCSHGKVALIRLSTGERYTLVGSANLRSSASIEILTVEDDPAVFAFHREWLAALETLYSTINHDHPHPSDRKTPGKRHQWQRAAPTAASTTPDPEPATHGATNRPVPPGPGGSNSGEAAPRFNAAPE
jgi:hypothetical protein